MRKVMLLAAMLAMVLAAAVPVFAQDADVAGDENVVATEGDDTQYNAVCQNVIGAIGDVTTTQSGEADATAVDDSAANAEVAQELGVSIATIEDCLDIVDEDDDGFVTVEEKKVVVATVTATASPTATATASPTATASAAAELPETGGASVIALGAGALLVAGGLLARRIVR